MSPLVLSAASIAHASAATKKQLHLFNSQTRQRQPFTKDVTEKVSMYTCGPTVYDSAHIGNLRAFLTYDLLKRVLMFLGYAYIEHICNLTDVDDKIIQRANNKELKDVGVLTRHYEEQFRSDLAALNIIPATHYPRATEHIDDMMEMILVLNEKGMAYETEDGSWYFRTQAQSGYGTKLVNMDYDDMKQQDRITIKSNSGVSITKEHPADFCLWKAFRAGVDREDTAWSSNLFQKGRPGWHIECSAMKRHFFGDEPLDFHGGGVDLKFPHHENEIAQSEGASGSLLCNCWFHNGFINMDSSKMSKSLGNFLKLQTACPTAEDVRAYRYMVITSHYRKDLPFTKQSIKSAKKTLQRLDKVRSRLSDCTTDGSVDDNVGSATIKALDNFEMALVDDLNTPRAAACLFDTVKLAEGQLKKETITTGTSKILLDAIDKMDEVFGVFYDVPGFNMGQDATSLAVPDNVMGLVRQRADAKRAKNWETADELRKQITNLGFSIKDVKGDEPVITWLGVEAQ